MVRGVPHSLGGVLTLLPALPSEFCSSPMELRPPQTSLLAEFHLHHAGNVSSKALMKKLLQYEQAAAFWAKAATSDFISLDDSSHTESLWKWEYLDYYWPFYNRVILATLELLYLDHWKRTMKNVWGFLETLNGLLHVQLGWWTHHPRKELWTSIWMNQWFWIKKMLLFSLVECVCRRGHAAEVSVSLVKVMWLVHPDL